MDPFWGGFGLQRGHFSVKMYAKTKELGPVGGGRASARPTPPPPQIRLWKSIYLSAQYNYKIILKQNVVATIVTEFSACTSPSAQLRKEVMHMWNVLTMKICL